MSEYKLADRLNGLEESATLALNTQANQLKAEGKTIYNLTAGELATETPDYIQDAVAKKLNSNGYTPVAGLPELRQLIASQSRQYYKLDWIKPENVVVTAGVKPALFACFQLLINPGDEVIVPTPGWTVTYKPLIELARGVCVEAPLTTGFDLDVPAIVAAITSKTKAIIVNSPQNPTGTIYSEAKLKELAEKIKGSNITIISDDIYNKLIYSPDYTSPAACGFERIIILNGFSKSQALTGWRIGYLIAETKIAQAATNLLSHVTANASVISQYAGIEAMNRQDAPPASTLDDLEAQRQVVIDGLSSIPEIKCNQPGGGFYIFIDLRDITEDSFDWCQRLLNQAGVALVPGEAFSAPGFARLTYTSDTSTLKLAIEKIKQFIGGKL